MLLSAIVTIVLRLFSLLWLVHGISMFASAAAMLAPYPSGHSNYWSYAAPILITLLAIGAFLFSQPIARIVTPPPNPECSLGGLSQYDLYCFAFTFLGLYFVLSSLANAINWLHYLLLVTRNTYDNDPHRQKGLYELSRPLITLISGGASMFFASRCARKLTTIQSKHEIA